MMVSILCSLPPLAIRLQLYIHLFCLVTLLCPPTLAGGTSSFLVSGVGYLTCLGQWDASR